MKFSVSNHTKGCATNAPITPGVPTAYKHAIKHKQVYQCVFEAYCNEYLLTWCQVAQDDWVLGYYKPKDGSFEKVGCIPQEETCCCSQAESCLGVANEFG